MDDSSPKVANIRPHPLAAALRQRLPPGARVLELGSGRGRNAAALREAGLHVHAISDEQTLSFTALHERFDGALSTHGFLHGRAEQIVTLLGNVAASLEPGAPLYATFGSTRDARFGRGIEIGKNAYAAKTGPERGVPHAFFDRAALTKLLRPEFAIESLTEQDVDGVVDPAAHVAASGMVHWFVRAVRG